MSSQSDPLYKQASLALIDADADLFFTLLFSPRLEPIRPTAVAVLMPFVSAFLYEAIRHTKQENPEALRELRSHQEFLRASRMRMKLLDGDPRTLDELLADGDELAAAVKRLFMKDHRGVLGPLKRLLQDDLGVHFVRGEVVGTLHVALLNAGLPNETLSTLSWEDIGRFLRDIAEGFGWDAMEVLIELGISRAAEIDAYRAEAAPEHPISRPQYLDLKSERFYGSMAQRTAPGRNGVGVVLTSILSQVNSARIIVPMVAEQNEVAAFKVRFVSLFHAASSLQNLLNKHQSNPFLHPDAVQQIRAMLGASAVRSIRKRKSLRHALVHYGLDASVETLLDANLPLFGLIEALAAGQSLDAVACEVDSGLDSVSGGLGSLLPRPLTPQGTL